MPDTRPMLVPVYVNIGGVQHAGTYELRDGALTVRHEAESMTVELGAGNAGKRAQEVLGALVKQERRKSSRPPPK